MPGAKKKGGSAALHSAPPALPLLEEAAALLLRHAEGANWAREGLLETPKRFAAAWRHYTRGYSQDPKAVLKEFGDGAATYDEMVIVQGIQIHSLCEHHLAPIFGVAHIGYIPRGKIVGLSKLSRLADVFAGRLQVQERLTRQIADALNEHLDPVGVGVMLQCRHLCMEARGIQKMGTITTTTAMYGALRKDASARAEFLQSLQIHNQI